MECVFRSAKAIKSTHELQVPYDSDMHGNGNETCKTGNCKEKDQCPS
jgi:hypothetical protein